MKKASGKLLFLMLVSLPGASAWAQQSHPATSAKTPVAAPQHAGANQATQLLFGSLQVSTKSPEARRELEAAFERYENYDVAGAILHARVAIKRDPNFALAYALLFYAEPWHAGAAEDARKARVLVQSKGTPGDEKLLVNFFIGVQQADLLPAIAAMNDLVKAHPADKHVLYLAGEWLHGQLDYARARELLEGSLAQDPGFAPALNTLGYSYMMTTEPDPSRALSLLQQYADALPKDPNPQDSLGEILRMSGDDDGSLTHYAAALDISPKFLTSQYGRGDTYLLMGKFAEAQAEYQKALTMAASQHDRFHVQMQKALLRFQQGDAKGGQAALAELSRKATEAQDWVAVFEIDFARVMLAPNQQQANRLLTALQRRIMGGSENAIPTERNTQYARVLREKVRLAAASQKLDAAESSLHKLEQLAGGSRQPRIESIYESARGYIAYAKGDYVTAAECFTADPSSPLVMYQWLAAEQKLGDAAGVERAQNRLHNMRLPTAEWLAASKVNAAENAANNPAEQ
jgi:tetratricopeptide (TPR) repeat protein